MKLLSYFINILMDISRHNIDIMEIVKLIHLFLIILEKLTKKLSWLNIKKETINGKNIFLQKIIIS